jgi:hypothetical protein
METVPPRWFYERSAIFGTEYEMVMKAEVGGRHDVRL